jgi:hypothetical protein
VIKQAVSATNFRVLFCCLALMLAGCATVPPPSMSVDEIASFKLVGVEVRGVEVIRSWPAQEQAYIASGKADPEIVRRLPGESAQNFLPVQAQFQLALQQTLSTEFGNVVAPLLRGSRPVKAIVRLKTFNVPSVVLRVLIDHYAVLDAAIDLVDPKTGESILSYAGRLKSRDVGGGLIRTPIFSAIDSALGRDEPGTAMIKAYVSDYAEWLVSR